MDACLQGFACLVTGKVDYFLISKAEYENLNKLVSILSTYFSITVGYRKRYQGRRA